MKKYQAVIITLLFATSLVAQTDFRKGYVIKNEGDTLLGEIDYRGDITMGEVCTFRQNKAADIIRFYPGEIIGYRFTDSKYFVSKKVDDKQIFLEYLINGKISIYYFRDNEFNDHYFVEKVKDELIELPYERGIRTKDGVDYQYESTKHIGLLSYCLQDAPDLIPMINKMKQPEHKNLIALAEKYHKEVCDGEKCIIYEKKLPPFKVNFELVGGVTHINSNFNNDNGNAFPKSIATGGVLAHIWMPRISENLYLKTGGVFLKGLENPSSIYLFKIPLQFEYLYPKGIIRPRASIGFDDLITLPVCSVGANIKLYKIFYLSVNYDINFYSENSEFALPNRFFSHSLYAGLYLSL